MRRDLDQIDTVCTYVYCNNNNNMERNIEVMIIKDI